MDLQETINEICEELEESSINKQRKRYLSSYLEDLFEYQKNNPTATQTPTTFELFCSLNPDSSECKIYDD
jgi:hypothetical protein